MAAAALLASGCSPPAGTPDGAALQFDDVETVFFGFNDPVERVGDQVRRLYGVGSVPLEMNVGQVDDTTLHVQVRSTDSDGESQGSPGVRCFEYSLDREAQQAQLEDLRSSDCSMLPDDGEA